jgi:hypothetical protein
MTRCQLVLAAAVLACTGVATAAPPASGSSLQPVRCPEAGRAAIVVPDGIDGFRVVVARATPGAATDVTVLAGDRDLTLRAQAAGTVALSVDTPWPAGRIEVAFEPVLDAPVGVCVARVELVRGGAVVGAAVIE